MALARIYKLFFLTYCFYAFQLYGQDISPSFRNFTTVQGLPSSEVYKILQDKTGNIWFGTDRGVARFNGYEFRTFTFNDGLTDNTVFKLFEDRSGRIWMLTYSGKIFYHEYGKIFPYKYNEFLAGLNQSRLPLGFYIDSLENVFVNIRDLGILMIDKEGRKEWRYKIEDRQKINFLIDELTDSNILVSIIHAVSKTSQVNVLHIRKGRKDTLSIVSDFGNRISALRLSDDRLIFSIGSSLYMKSDNSFSLLRELPSEVFTLFKDKQENVIAGTSGGVYFFAHGNFKNPAHHYLGKNNISGILQDHEGGYWFATLDNGVYYMSGFGIEGIRFDDERIQKPISLTTDYKHSIYAGCWSGALVRIRRGEITDIYEQKKQELLQPVTNLTSFPFDDKIYLSRSGPAYFLDGEFYQYKTGRALGIKTKFVRTPDGSLYCGGSAFVMKVNRDSIIQIEYLSQRINCLGETKEHKLLVGCNRGVFVLDTIGHTSMLYRKELIDVRVDDIRQIGKYLLFATKGKGILACTDDRIIQVDESKGLCSDLVNKLLVTGDEIWCITNKGISRLHVMDLDKFTFTITNIHSNEGLFVDEINDIALLNDTIYVAMNPGISFFNIHTDFVNHTSPPVYISSVRVNNRDTSFYNEMQFSHDSNNLQIGFNGISYRSSDKMVYSYALIHDKDTLKSLTTNREVEFLTLQPGKYVFNVMARNNSGVWSREPATFTFVINPAWWQTRTFIILVILGFFVLMFLWYKDRIRKLNYNFEMKRRQAELQLTAMRAQMNPHFIFNVMNSIRNYMQNHDMRSAEKYLTSFSKLVRYTLDYSEVQEVTLEEELMALRNYTELEMQRFDNGFEFNIQCEEGIDLKETMLLSMVLQPFVENAIKHGISGMKSGAKILIDVRREGDSILIAVEDNGCGIEENCKEEESPDGKLRPHGTSINLERIEAYNKVYNKNIKTRFINLKDSEGRSAGTRVEVLI